MTFSQCKPGAVFSLEIIYSIVYGRALVMVGGNMLQRVRNCLSYYY